MNRYYRSKTDLSRFIKMENVEYDKPQNKEKYMKIKWHL